MPTDCLFRDDAYRREADATVIDATSGGQPGDRGALITAGGGEIPIVNAIYTDAAKTEIAHMPGGGAAPPILGETVTARIDWELRFRRMRMHTALHLLSAVLPYPVTGGAVGETESRLDFDIPEAGLDKDEITRKLAEMIAADVPVVT